MAQLDFLYKDSDNTYLAHFNDYSQKLSKLIANKPMDKVTSDTIYFKFEQKELCDALSCSETLLNSILESVSRHPCGLEWHEGNEYYRKSIKPLLLIFFGKKGGNKIKIGFDKFTYKMFSICSKNK